MESAALKCRHLGRLQEVGTRGPGLGTWGEMPAGAPGVPHLLSRGHGPDGTPGQGCPFLRGPRCLGPSPVWGPLTDNDGAGAQQPDLLLERHPLRGPGARARAGRGRGRRAGVPAPAQLSRVAGHASVPPRPLSLPALPRVSAGGRSVGPSGCRSASRPGSGRMRWRGARAAAPGRQGPEGRKEGWPAAPSPTFLKGRFPRASPSPLRPQSRPGREGDSGQT